MFDSDKIVIFRSKDSLMIKYVDYNEGIYDDDKSILYMTSKNDSEESFEFMVQKSNDELIDFVKNLYNEYLIQDLDKKLSGEIPITREELISLVSSWGRKESFVTNDKIQISNVESNTIEYIDIKSEKYNKLNIDEKIKVLNDNLDILNKNVDDNNKLLQKTKTTYSKDESIDPNTKKLIFAEFEKRCKESNSIINDSINKNQNELEKQLVKKSLSDTNIDFDIFKR